MSRATGVLLGPIGWVTVLAQWCACVCVANIGMLISTRCVCSVVKKGLGGAGVTQVQGLRGRMPHASAVLLGQRSCFALGRVTCACDVAARFCRCAWRRGVVGAMRPCSSARVCVRTQQVWPVCCAVLRLLHRMRGRCVASVGCAAGVAPVLGGGATRAPRWWLPQCVPVAL